MSDEAFNLDWSEEERALWDAGRAEIPETSAETKLSASLGLFSPDPGGGEPKGGRVTRPETGLVAPKALVPLALVFGLAALGGALYFVNHSNEDLVARPLEKSATSFGGYGFETKAPKDLRLGRSPIATGDAGKLTTPLGSSLRTVEVADEGPESGVVSISLGEELAMIKRARALLSAGDAKGAEAALDEYRSKVKAPRLASEALFVRVEVLVAAGKRDRALELAKPLRAADSPYRSRVEALLGSP